MISSLLCPFVSSILVALILVGFQEGTCFPGVFNADLTHSVLQEYVFALPGTS
jgi:hypothetical protein